MKEQRFANLDDTDSPVSRLASAPTSNSRSQRLKRFWGKRVMPIVGAVALVGVVAGGGWVAYETIAHPLKSSGTNEIEGGGGGQLNKQNTEVGGLVTNQAVQGGAGIAGGGGVSGRSHNGTTWAHYAPDVEQEITVQVLSASGAEATVAYLNSFAKLRLTGEALLVHGAKLKRGDQLTFSVLGSKITEAFGLGGSKIGDLGAISSLSVTN